MTKRRILVIDDNPSLHEDFKKILVGISSEAEARLSKAAQGLFGTLPSRLYRCAHAPRLGRNHDHCQNLGKSPHDRNCHLHGLFRLLA